MGTNQLPFFVFVTGGVISGLGKGITAASLGAVFKARGLKVKMQKLDVYLNVDAGTMNPAQHGEVFVTKDGAETDLDLGHYERFLDMELTQASSTMSGKLYLRTIEEERNGRFLGEDVQIVPHFTSIIQEDIINSGQGADIHIVEIGGTVGDIESTAFLEAIREMDLRFAGRCAYAHVVYMPFLGTTKEFKTKPVQNALRDLRSIGIVPDLTLVRGESEAPQSCIQKISMFGGVPLKSVIMLPNAKTVYQVPLTLQEHGAAEIILEKFGIKTKQPDMSRWKVLAREATTKYPKKTRIGIVAKYLDNEDTYLSVIEALRAAARANKVDFSFEWIDAVGLEDGDLSPLHKVDGILVPGGFGSRGLEGKIAAARYAMDNNVPYLGICLGMQMAVIAAARKAGLKDAQTSEVDSAAKHPVIYIMDDQKGKEATGGSMRLGNYECVLTKGSQAAKLFGAGKIIERHRHRYEVNQKYKDYYEKSGLVISGYSPDGRLAEIIEIPGHPYFMGIQSHPEFRSRPDKPHPLFSGLIAASIKK